MQKRAWLFTTVMVFALLLAACGGTNSNNGTGNTLDGTGTAESIPNTGETLEVTEVATDDAVEPTAAETTEVPTEAVDASPTAEVTETGDDDNTSVIGIPETGSGGFAGLGAMFGFRVEDSAGNEIGIVEDYIINMCEANILYMVVTPSEVVGAEGSGSILIPYQATLETPNEGSVNAGEQVFVINTVVDDLSGAPAFDVAALDLQNPEWDAGVQSYWGSNFELALTTACPVPVGGETTVTDDDGAGQQDMTATPAATLDATPQTTPDATQTVEPAGEATREVDRQNVYRIALASSLLQASLVDGNAVLLGTVRDIAILPETGRTEYILVQMSGETGEGDDSRLVALPPGAVNVQYVDGSDQPELVLLVETGAFQGAPAFNADTPANGEDWYSYWEQYVPMTMDQLP